MKGCCGGYAPLDKAISQFRSGYVAALVQAAGHAAENKFKDHPYAFPLSEALGNAHKSISALARAANVSRDTVYSIDGIEDMMKNPGDAYSLDAAMEQMPSTAGKRVLQGNLERMTFGLGQAERDFKAAYVHEVYEEAGSLDKAAEILDVDARTVWNHLKHYRELELPEVPYQREFDAMLDKYADVGNQKVA